MSRLRRWRVRREMRRAKRILARLDQRMKAAKLLRAERRRFWREAHSGRLGLSDAVSQVEEVSHES